MQAGQRESFWAGGMETRCLLYGRQRGAGISEWQKIRFGPFDALVIKLICRQNTRVVGEIAAGLLKAFRKSHQEKALRAGLDPRRPTGLHVGGSRFGLRSGGIGRHRGRCRGGQAAAVTQWHKVSGRALRSQSTSFPCCRSCRAVPLNNSVVTAP